MIDVEELKIAEPCCEDWDAMIGDARRRHCLQCDKDVVNLSTMTEGEARAFLKETKNSCIRYTYSQENGQVFFLDPQLRNQRRGLKQMVAAAALVMPLSLSMAACELETYDVDIDDHEPVAQPAQIEEPAQTEPSAADLAEFRPAAAVPPPIVERDGEASLDVPDKPDADEELMMCLDIEGAEEKQEDPTQRGRPIPAPNNDPPVIMGLW